MKIPVSTPSLTDKELDCVVDALRSGWISGSKGAYIDKFETEFSGYCGTRFGVACSSGTAALHLATSALNLEQGDEVIVPTFTNIATILAVIYAGGKPVLVDSDPEIWGMDHKQLETKISKRTKAIIPVHIYGHPVDMDAIMKIAHDHNLIVIEDAAEAHGAKCRGKMVGGIGDMGCFSFYANKIITTGEGGMLVTNNETYAKFTKMLCNLAFSDVMRYRHEHLGFNYRMSNLLAALGYAQLLRIDKLVAIKREIGARYNSLLSGLPGVTIPIEKPWATNVYWVYGILVNESFGMTRDELRNFLATKGVETRTFFVPMHLQPAFLNREMFVKESHPVSEKLSREGLYLPSGMTLTNEEIRFVVECIKEAAEKAK